MRSKPSILAIALIVIGVLFLLRNLGWIPDGGALFNTWWPAILIVAGGWLLFKRRAPRA